MDILPHGANTTLCSERSGEVGIMMNVGAVSIPVARALDLTNRYT